MHVAASPRSRESAAVMRRSLHGKPHPNEHSQRGEEGNVEFSVQRTLVLVMVDHIQPWTADVTRAHHQRRSVGDPIDLAQDPRRRLILDTGNT